MKCASFKYLENITRVLNKISGPFPFHHSILHLMQQTCVHTPNLCLIFIQLTEDQSIWLAIYSTGLGWQIHQNICWAIYWTGLADKLHYLERIEGQICPSSLSKWWNKFGCIEWWKGTGWEIWFKTNIKREFVFSTAKIYCKPASLQYWPKQLKCSFR